MNRPRSLLRTVGSISSATMISRVLGLVRDQVQSYYFGAGQITDAFVAAFRIPNLLRDLFAEGALSSAFVPTFTAERERAGDQAAWRLANRVIAVLVIVLGTLAVGIALGAPWILELFAPGFDGAKQGLAATMTRVLSPFLLFVAMAAVAMGALNAFGRFFVPALAPASFNVCAILGVVILAPLLPRLGYEPGLALAIGAIVGGAMQFAVQLPALHGVGFRLRPELRLSDPGVRRIARLMVPAVVGLAATQVNILVDTVLASLYGDGPITWLQLAFRLMQLPIGVFGVAIATANLTRVSRDAARGDLAALRGNLAASMRAAALLALPASAGLIALREPIVRLLFEHGTRFDRQDTESTAAAVLCYAFGLFAYSVTKIQVPTFYALGDTRTPVRSSVVAVATKIAANFVLIWLLRRAGVSPFLGLALSTSLAAWVNFGQLAIGLKRRIGALEGEGVVRSWAAMAAVSTIMGLACALFHPWLEQFLPDGGLLGELGRLVVTLALGLSIWLAGVLVSGIPEGRQLLARLRRRAGGGGVG